VGGLGHFLEDEGVATVQVSLVREHTETMRPPRALWVPFMLGRPLGVPEDPEFQKRVLRAALALFAAPSGPVLKDYAEEAPEVSVEDEGWVCPIAFNRKEDASLGERLRREVQQYRTWYDLHVQKRGRTSVGVSGLDLEILSTFLVNHAEGGSAESPDPEIGAARMLRLAVDDLKTFFFEAAEAQPGAASPNQLNEWFWTSTTAGETIIKLWRQVKDADDRDFKRLSVLVVPREWLPKDG
jgi:hypothetical protein